MPIPNGSKKLKHMAYKVIELTIQLKKIEKEYNKSKKR